MRIVIYVDGLNLFYQCQKGGINFYWIDIEKLCHAIITEEFEIEQYTIANIKYFAAPLNVSKNRNPSTAHVFNHYVKTLKKELKNFEYIKGKFKITTSKMRLTENFKLKNNLNLDEVEVIRSEEKNTDVNIATHILDDAWRDAYDCAILISNDSDLKEALRFVNESHKDKRIGVVCPVGKNRYPIGDLVHQAYTCKKSGTKYVYTLNRDEKKIQNSQLSASLKPNKFPKSWK